MASTLVSGKRGWREYWANKTTPLHARETEADFRALAGELRLLYADHRIDSVLEVGCGNGAMFTHLGFDAAPRYVGIDFSQAMLDSFSERFPDAELLVADAAEFQTTEKFDLVFSSHASQYWNRAQLASHLDRAASMITAGGLIVIAGTPWSRMRLAYGRGDLTGGDLTGGQRRRLPMAAWSAVRELIRPDIGHWYDLPDFTTLASARGLQVAFRGSGHYPYRFHAIFRRG
ncbi:MAG: hypothetical protein QOE53_921 [Pseudonocardiales bacterium]|jgi:SAM-dependent methyltransferase|nr:hypothetical protein [Pseudonocardiales bacterium]